MMPIIIDSLCCRDETIRSMPASQQVNARMARPFADGDQSRPHQDWLHTESLHCQSPLATATLPSMDFVLRNTTVVLPCIASKLDASISHMSRH